MLNVNGRVSMLNVDNTKVTVVDEWVSINALCKALKIYYPRQREKAKAKYATIMKRMPKLGYKQGSNISPTSIQRCISMPDALDFISNKGVWKRPRKQFQPIPFAGLTCNLTI